LTRKKKDSKKKGGEDGKKKVTKKKKEILTEEDLPELSFQSEEIGKQNESIFKNIIILQNKQLRD
jgi:hypothetical protein